MFHLDWLDALSGRGTSRCPAAGQPAGKGPPRASVEEVVVGAGDMFVCWRECDFWGAQRGGGGYVLGFIEAAVL